MKRILNRIPPIELIVYGFYLLVALLITWPLITVIGTHFIGFTFGDAHEMTRMNWWFTYALRTGAPLVFQPLLGYPDGMQGMALWADPLQYFPGWFFALFMPPAMGYNVAALLTLALNGWAAQWLVWKLTGQRGAALLGGLVFLAAPTIQGHLAGGHGGLVVQWTLPLLAYHLLALGDMLPRRAENPPYRAHVLLAALFYFCLPLSHTLQFIYATMPLVGTLLLTLLVRRRWAALRRLLGVCVAGTGMLFVFLLPTASATFGTSVYTEAGGGVTYSADLLSLFTPSFRHPLYGQWDFTHRVLGVNIVEGHSYIGIAAGLLALLAAWKRPALRWWLLLGGVAFVLSLGPLLKLFDQPVTLSIGGYRTNIVLPWALVADLPGIVLARTPGRFNFLLALVVAVLAGGGWALVGLYVRQPRVRAALLTLTLGAILFDYQAFWPQPTYLALVPQAVHDLAQRDDVRAVFDLPWDNLLAAKHALWLQTAHQQPIIAGQVTRRTPVSPAKLTLLEQELDPFMLDEASVDVVILHKDYASAELSERARRALGEPTFEDAQIALFEVPPPGQSPFVSTTPTRVAAPNRHELYFYTPGPAWALLDGGVLAGDRTITAYLDDQVIQRWLPGDARLPLALPLLAHGYHTLALEAAPPCPEVYDPALTCQALESVGTLELSAVLAAEAGEAVQYGRGVTLRAAAQPDVGEVWLWWQFDEALSEQDVRFVVLVNAAGERVAGDDRPLGALPAGEMRVDRVLLELPADLPAGEYRLFAGWYTYPDLTRFPVLSAVAGAADSMAPVGAWTVSEGG